MPDGIAAHADAHGHGHAPSPGAAASLRDLEQQQEASTLGMWLFLVTEVMFFGGLLLAYMLYRIWYPTAWSQGSAELDICLGGFNTVVLIVSSLTMALAVARRRPARRGRPWMAAVSRWRSA